MRGKTAAHLSARALSLNMAQEDRFLFYILSKARAIYQMHDIQKGSEISRSKVKMAEETHHKNASEERAARSMKIGRRIGNSILCAWVAFSLWPGGLLCCAAASVSRNTE